ncbi:PHP domain-containing protein [Ectothiorhodospiraceae bacterium 2226]|nr:PHP domain-containing protein [Ectothiorhodospiraceae bacterium 2226]
MAVVHDLHAHSTYSDGTLTPTLLVRRAQAQGVGVLALTDHDGLDGLPEAEAAARECGIRLIPGVEVSVSWAGRTLHVLGLGVDPADAGLREGLARLRAFRGWRAEEIARRLEAHGIPDAYAGAKGYAHGAIIGRTHFARHLLALGKARNFGHVFKRYLTQGKPGHVPGQWASLEEALGWIHGAGGQAVLAHPARYKLTRTKLNILLEEFRAAGGEGLEVISGSHAPRDSVLMATFARRHGLLASVGSDFHDPDGGYAELGRLPELPAGCRPIWHTWH